MYMHFFLTCLLILPAPAFAQSYMGDFFNKPRPFSMDIQYSTYSDIVLSQSNPTATIDDTISANLNARFYRIFSLTGSYGRATGEGRSFYGLGFKIDLPGFFYVSGVANDFVRKRKLRNVNTYLYVGKMIVSEPGFDRFVDDKFAFGSDFFLAGDVYLNLEISIISNQGNQFISPAIGIGYEF